MRIRDPIHGAIAFGDAERQIVDSGFFQRLRYVKQLGFGELAFPGATHSRLGHSIGVMHVASRLFDAVFAQVQLPEVERARLRAAVRVAGLCHDLGHMPRSHASERVAPPRAALGLPAWLPGAPDAQASHEDFTAKLLLDSSLAEVLKGALAPLGLVPEAIAGLAIGAEPPGGSPFVASGRDFGPLLRQLVSGELDADRMDYLLRDSFYTGVNYGRYDLDWLVQNLLPIERSGKVYLGLGRAAIFGFEDFLLSRFHMFLSVYYHHTAVNFDEMLRRCLAEDPSFEIPADPERFLGCDDVALTFALRHSKNRWAQRIVARRGYKLVAQATEVDRDYDIPGLSRALDEAEVEHFTCESLSVLSRYFGSGQKGPPLYVYDPHAETVTPIERHTPLYQRYAGAVRLSRIYCLPEQADRARELVARSVRESQESCGNK
jgi:HD superfamily phosphohydrolase